MSTFNGVNIFGSGPHRIIIGGLQVAKQRSGYAGINGLVSKTIGTRGRPVVIAGQLRGASRYAVNILVGTIEAYCYAAQAYTLVDSDSNSYPNIELDNYAPDGPIKKAGAVYIQNYIVRGTQL